MLSTWCNLQIILLSCLKEEATLDKNIRRLKKSINICAVELQIIKNKKDNWYSALLCFEFALSCNVIFANHVFYLKRQSTSFFILLPLQPKCSKNSINSSGYKRFLSAGTFWGFYQTFVVWFLTIKSLTKKEEPSPNLQKLLVHHTSIQR